MKRKVFIITGEASGDLYGGKLAKTIKKLSKDIELEGMGGYNMLKAGVNLTFDISGLSGIGSLEVISKIPKFFSRIKEVGNYLKGNKPDLLILIDFPEFNMRLARVAKGLSIPTIYYIPPTVWAWRKGRAKIIAKLVDKVISIFDFEAKIYKEAGNNVEFVGHPLLDIAIPKMTKKEAATKFGLNLEKKIIGILPGSRKKEIDVLLPIMLSSIEKIQDYLPDVQFILPLAPTLSLPNLPPHIKVVKDNVYEVMNISDLLIVASGTATLEATCIGVPMIIIYKVNCITYWLGKLLVSGNTGGFIGLPNIVAGKEIVPELLQNKANPNSISQYAIDLLNNEKKRQEIINKLKEIKQKLGSPGATLMAAKTVVARIR